MRIELCGTVRLQAGGNRHPGPALKAYRGRSSTVESNGLSGHLICVVLLVESGRRKIAKSRLLTNAVVEDFDVLRDFPLGLLSRSKAMEMRQFGACQKFCV